MINSKERHFLWKILVRTFSGPSLVASMDSSLIRLTTRSLDVSLVRLWIEWFLVGSAINNVYCQLFRAKGRS